MEASAKEGVLFGTFCLKCMQRELEYISKQMHEYVKISVISNYWVCVCVCVCV